MSWRDRDYNQAGDGGGNFLSNPGAILSYSVPFGTWFGARVRLHFWLLVSLLFLAMADLRSDRPLFLAPDLAMCIAAVLLHEFGHRLAATCVGGAHNEFVLWPAGGMVPPQAPPRPWPMFVAHAGGIAMNLLLAGLCAAALWHLDRPIPSALMNPLSVFGNVPASAAVTSSIMASCLTTFMVMNLAVVFATLLPYYWFDGGYLLQIILWPWTGLYQAINVTCIVGMVLAVPMFLLSVGGVNFLGMIFWGLLFASAYTRRKQLQAAGTGELEDAIAYSATLASQPARRGPASRRWWHPTARRNDARQRRERRQQQKIDAILEKVSRAGMNSLNWWERRTLKQATERQRQRGG